jgi:Cdc6-like AAA superfamily ATPase
MYSKITKLLFSNPVLDYLADQWQQNFDDRHYVPKKYRKLEGLPNELGVFNPFFSSVTDGPIEVWSREADRLRFERHIARNGKSHTIMTGPSGAGKTVFLKRIVQKNFGSRLRFPAYLPDSGSRDSGSTPT